MKNLLLLISACAVAFLLSPSGQGQTLPGHMPARVSPQGILADTAVPNRLSYQGLLSNSDGSPASDGGYDLKFELFDQSSGGTALWTEAQTGVSVQEGRFSVMLGSVQSLPQIFYKPLWLQVTAVAGPGIGSEVVFSPRSELASSPYALGPWQQNSVGYHLSSGSVGIGTSLPQALLDVGGKTMVKDSLLIGSTSVNGTVLTYGNGSSGPVTRIYQDRGNGGAMDFYDEAGNPTGFFQPDFDGQGGYFWVASVGGYGFWVDGNYNNAGSPEVGISGSDRAVIFDMSKSGDGSVALPESSISSWEILDEPGIAHAAPVGVFVEPSGVTNVTSASITVPAGGYILAFATGYIGLSGDTIGVIRAGIEENATSLSMTDIAVYGSPGELLSSPMTRWSSLAVERILAVSGTGTYTYYLNADRGMFNYGGNGNIWRTKLTLMYFPTSYGPVGALLASGAAASFSSAKAVTVQNDGALKEPSSTYYQVDLRDLELKAAKARADAERAERQLIEARIHQQRAGGQR